MIIECIVSSFLHFERLRASAYEKLRRQFCLFVAVIVIAVVLYNSARVFFLLAASFHGCNKILFVLILFIQVIYCERLVENFNKLQFVIDYRRSTNDNQYDAHARVCVSVYGMLCNDTHNSNRLNSRQSSLIRWKPLYFLQICHKIYVQSPNRKIDDDAKSATEAHKYTNEKKLHTIKCK